MIQGGAKPTRKDHRDYSLKKTFGAVFTSFDKEINVDAGFGQPDQNAEGMPYGCTGVTTKELGQDEDGIEYQAKYNYDKTRMIEGTYPQDVGCDIRNALKTAALYGLLPKSEPYDSGADKKAGEHRHGAYYNVIDPWNQYDAFDDVRSCITFFEAEKRSVSLGTPWFSEWQMAPRGILPIPYIPKELKPGFLGSVFRFFGKIFGSNFGANYSWHNSKICGFKEIDGQPYLIGKSWQGYWFGDNGYHYFSRELFSLLMTIPGTAAFTIAPKPTNKAEIKKIQISAMSWILSYCVMLLEKIRKQVNNLKGGVWA